MDTNSEAVLGTDEVGARLVEAVQDGRLRQVLQELKATEPRLTPQARVRVGDVSEALGAIDDAVRAEEQRLTERLLAIGIDVGSAAQLSDRPLHIVRLQVHPRHAARAAIELEAAGYRHVGPKGAAAWRAFRATRRGCSTTRGGRTPFRVELSWGARPWWWRGPLARALTPQQRDFDLVRLPVWLWPVYPIVHLIGLPARWRRARRDPVDLGPFLETPEALIEPLLRFAGLRAGERLVDIGCGDGRIPIAAARLFGCRALGLETNAELVARAHEAIAAAQVGDRVEVVCADASATRFDDADVVVAFLPVSTVQALLPAILDRLPPGARFVAHEQERLHGEPASARVALVTRDGITVAHRWDGRARS